MKKVAPMALVAALLLPATAHARAYGGGDVGLGVTLGSPSGIDAKFGLGGIHSLDAWLGVHFLLHDALGVGAEYNAEVYSFRVGSTHDGLYLGVGGMFTFLNHDLYHKHHHDHVDIGFGVRVPFGVDFVFDSAPVNLFAELAPGFTLVTDHGFDFLIDVAIGVRFML